MFDILVYVFENCRQADLSHDPDRIAKKLSAAGFEDHDISAALSWLAGCRVIELKTVQVKDDLKIPRPCIDMETVGFNVEWSQELRLEQSLEEYVKGAMLIEVLRASGKLPLPPGPDPVVYDMSVGYDLAGIRSERVQAFVAGMRDARAVVERLRREIPDEYRAYRELERVPGHRQANAGKAADLGREQGIRPQRARHFTRIGAEIEHAAYARDQLEQPVRGRRLAGAGKVWARRMYG